MTQRVAPNAAIVGQLKWIADTNYLKQQFPVLAITHKDEIQWNKPFILGSFVLGILAAYVYKQVHQNAGIVLGVASVALSLLKHRVIVEVPTEAYTEQCKQIQELFKGVALELRKTWEVVSNAICNEINQGHYKKVGRANEAITEFLKSIKDFNVNMGRFSDADKPWIAAFQQLQSIAAKIVERSMSDIQRDGLSPLVLEEFIKVYNEAAILVRGSFIELNNKRAYVENELRINGEGKAVVVSKPWPVDPFKA